MTPGLLRGANPPLAIGHRGAAVTAPENTMPAFEAAWQHGARWIETDVQPAKDGCPVLIHDDTVDRTTNGTGAVAAHTTAELQRLDAGTWFSPDYADTPIPTLAQLLAVGGDPHILLEIKGEHNTEQLRTLIAVIDDASAWHRVILQSFSVPVLRRLRELRPQEPLGLLVETITPDASELCRSLNAAAFNPNVDELLRRPHIVTDMHREDIAVITWTSNHPAEWHLLTELGVDGIMTDDPAALIHWQNHQFAEAAPAAEHSPTAPA